MNADPVQHRVFCDSLIVKSSGEIKLTGDDIKKSSWNLWPSAHDIYHCDTPKHKMYDRQLGILMANDKVVSCFTDFNAYLGTLFNVLCM